MNQLDPEKIGLLLSETARAWRTRLDQRLRPLGLSQGKWTALVHLAVANRPLTQRDVAERVGVEEPTMAGVLRRLENDGWVRRQPCREDRRCKTVHLERRSKKVLESILATARHLRHELLTEISRAELQTCMSVLDRIRAKADALSTNGTSHLNGHRRIKGGK